MRTSGRGGEALSGTELSSQYGRDGIRYGWQAKLIDMVGSITAADWIYRQIPQAAILSRSRSASVDGTTWRLSLSLVADQLPDGVVPKRYHRLEIDRVHMGQWPYFTGVIDAVETGWARQDGAVVATYEITAFGVMQRCKGYWIDQATLAPVADPFAGGRLLGIAPNRRWKISTVLGIGGVENVPTMWAYDITTQLNIAPNENMTGAYVFGVDYTLSTVSFPWTVTWNVNPAEPRWYEIPVPERFGIPTQATTLGTFRTLPYGRDPDDLYHTLVAASGYSSGAKTITVKDPVPFKSGNNFLNGAVGEWVTVTQASTGAELTRKLANPANDANGVLTHIDAVIAFADGANPVENDLVRISTTELYQSWRNITSSEILYYSNDLLTVKHKRASFTTLAQSGIVIPVLGRNFTGTTTNSLYVNSAVEPNSESNTANQVEEIIKTIITSSIKLFPAADVTATKTGAYIKNFTHSDIDLADLIGAIKAKALPPNAYILDQPDGKITIKPYKQVAAPDWSLFGASSITEEAEPEPITRVVVMAVEDDDEPQADNMAARWLINTTNVTNPDRIIDGSKTLAATTSSASMTAIFRKPADSPKEIHPNIQELIVTGRGFLTIYVIRDPEGTPTTRYLTDVSRMPVGMSESAASAATNSTGSVTISGETILPGLNTGVCDIYCIMEEDDTPGTVISPIINEIEVKVKNLVAWSASLSDDDATAPTADLPPGYTGTVPSGWKPSDAALFGPFWWQPSPKKRESVRYAPTDHLKRVLALYDSTGATPAAKARANQRHRTAIVELPGISQQDSRDIAERYLDEYTRVSRRYRVTAPLFDAAELGDTVNVACPAGYSFWDGTKNKNLMLWELADSGDVNDTIATYGFVDYSL